MAQPSYAKPSLEELGLLVDEIYHLAGDRSVDSSWYTKRASLAAIYGSAELYMTSDRSPGFSETREFLRRRFDETKALAGFANSVGQWASFAAAGGLNVLRSKGMRI
jgi:ubiquinone biosynthesis protein COQ9